MNRIELITSQTKYFLLLSACCFMLTQLMSCGNKTNTDTPGEEIIYTELVPANDPLIQYTGRFYYDENKVSFAMSACQIKARFQGSLINMLLKNYSPDTGHFNENYFNIYIDDQEPFVLKVNNTDTIYELANGLSDGQHTVRIVKRTEAACGVCDFYGFQLAEGQNILTPPMRAKHKIEFVGNSLVAGYGVESEKSEDNFSPETENVTKSFAAICADKLHAEYSTVCYSGLGVYRNYDSSWKQNILELYYRIYPQHGRRWDFTIWMPELVIVNLGTNDFALGIPDSGAFVRTYANLLLLIQEQNPHADIICVDGPMISNSWPINEETGKPYPSLKICRSYINAAINELENQGIDNIYHFSLSTSGKFGYGADWHPNAAQHKANGEELAEYIHKIKGWELF